MACAVGAETWVRLRLLKRDGCGITTCWDWFLLDRLYRPAVVVAGSLAALRFAWDDGS